MRPMDQPNFLYLSPALPMRWAASLLAALLLAPSLASAAACGDDVDGKRVPCSCGDNVVSDTTLWPTDPVTAEPCSGEGLTILAPVGSPGITLNLGGQSIVGTGRGTGIRVARGGTLGSTIVGGDREDARAEIARFGIGIAASGRSELREVRNLDVHDNSLDGLRLRTSGVRVEDVVTSGNGRNGAALSGHGLEVSGVVAAGNAKDGLQVRGTGATVEAESRGNRRNGVVVGGRGNRLGQVTSESNAGVGLFVSGEGHDVQGLQVRDNAAGEVAGRSGAAR